MDYVDESLILLVILTSGYAYTFTVKDPLEVTNTIIKLLAE